MFQCGMHDSGMCSMWVSLLIAKKQNKITSFLDFHQEVGGRIWEIESYFSSEMLNCITPGHN